MAPKVAPKRSPDRRSPCDIAYSDSPAASRASARSWNIPKRVICPFSTVHTNVLLAITSIPSRRSPATSPGQYHALLWPSCSSPSDTPERVVTPTARRRRGNVLPAGVAGEPEPTPEEIEEYEREVAECERADRASEAIWVTDEQRIRPPARALTVPTKKRPHSHEYRPLTSGLALQTLLVEQPLGVRSEARAAYSRSPAASRASRGSM